MSDANTASLAYVAETILGTPPPGSTLTALRYTGEALSNAKETAQSQEIRADRQIPDLAKVGEQPEGNWNFELSWAAQQVFLAGVLQSDWVTINIPALESTIETTDQSITGAAADFNGVPIGALVKVAGAVTALNNGKKRVIGKSVDGSKLTFAAGSFTADEVAVDLTFTGKTISNGIARKSFTFEKGIRNTAGTTFYQLYHGMVADTLELTIESKRIITGTFSFIGTKPGLGDDTISAAPYTAAALGDVLNGTSNMGAIVMDGVTAQDKFKGLNLTISNNLRGKDALGELGNFDIGMGTIAVNGDFNAYFRNNELLAKVHDHTSFSLDFGVSDAQGRSLHVYLPNVKPANGDPVIEAINTDVMVSTEWQAILDPVSGKTIIFDVHE